MIKIRREEERHHVQDGKHDMWLTFHPENRPDRLADAFAILTIFGEVRLPPGTGAVPPPPDEAEVVTHVHRGALVQEDSTGHSGVVHPGEFQCMSTGRGIRHKETNASRSDWVHMFRWALRPSEAGLDCAYEQKRFAAAQRRNVLCVVASPDGRKGSLRVHQDVLLYSSVLDPGHHLIHELRPGRSAWLHLMYGEATVRDIILNGGDGAGFTVEPSVSLTAQENTEILLVDFGPPPRPRF